MNRKLPDLIAKNSFTAYLAATVKRTTLYGMIGSALTYARRFFFITRLFRYISIAFAIIETSAILILLAGVLLSLIPILAAALIFLAAADFVIGNRMLKSDVLRDALAREQICVIAGADRFGDGFAREMAERGMTVFVISADIRRRFITARSYDGVIYIRHAFFFRLKRRRFAAMPERMIYLL